MGLLLKRNYFLLYFAPKALMVVVGAKDFNEALADTLVFFTAHFALLLLQLAKDTPATRTTANNNTNAFFILIYSLNIFIETDHK